MSDSNIDDYDLSGVPTLDCDYDNDDGAWERRDAVMRDKRAHLGCRDHFDVETVCYPFRAPQPAMFEAIAAALRSERETAFFFTVYDATTAWALQFAREERVESWDWGGPYDGIQTAAARAFTHWFPVQHEHVRLFWWDGERLHEVPRASAPGKSALAEGSV